MTETKIKFCGLRHEEDVKYAASLDAGFFGFILSERFKRYIAPGEIRRLKQFVPSNAKTVGVFVDEPEEYVIACSKEADLDMIQLHGSEDDAYIMSIKEKTGLPVIKMVKPVSEGDIITARQSKADLILLDSGAGGTGKLPRPGGTHRRIQRLFRKAVPRDAGGSAFAHCARGINDEGQDLQHTALLRARRSRHPHDSVFQGLPAFLRLVPQPGIAARAGRDLFQPRKVHRLRRLRHSVPEASACVQRYAARL